MTLAVSFLRGPAIEPIVVRRIDSRPGLAAVVGRHMLAMGRGLAASIGPIARIVVAPTLFLNPVMRSGLLICPRTVASYCKFEPIARSWEDATSGEMS